VSGLFHDAGRFTFGEVQRTSGGDRTRTLGRCILERMTKLAVEITCMGGHLARVWLSEDDHEMLKSSLQGAAVDSRGAIIINRPSGEYRVIPDKKLRQGCLRLETEP